MSTTKFASAADIAGLAFRFVLIVRIVNLFAEMTYEGVRSTVNLQIKRNRSELYRNSLLSSVSQMPD